MLALLPALTEIFFAFDSSTLPGSARDDLAHIVDAAKAHPDQRVVIEGHCDPIGTAVYNTGLSIRRAEVVHMELIALGIDPDRIVITYFGKDGAPRASYHDDRRATIYLTNDSLAQVTDNTFDGHGIAVRWALPKTVAEIQSTNPVAIK